MSNPSPLIPRQAVPPLQVPTLDHGNFSLAETPPRTSRWSCSIAACTARSA